VKLAEKSTDLLEREVLEKVNAMFLLKLVGKRIERMMASISNNYAEAAMLIRKLPQRYSGLL